MPLMFGEDLKEVALSKARKDHVSQHIWPSLWAKPVPRLGVGRQLAPQMPSTMPILSTTEVNFGRSQPLVYEVLFYVIASTIFPCFWYVCIFL